MKKALLAVILLVALMMDAVGCYAVEYKDKETVTEVQQALNDQGFDCGNPDGIAGRRTKEAITTFQKANNLPETGVVDDELLVALGLTEEPVPACLELTEKDIKSIITFGSYPQTSKGNDSTPIEWLVLDVQDGKALLLSNLVLDTKQYHTRKVDITWEECSLRDWLNTDFLTQAFNREERAAIQLTTVKNPGNKLGDFASNDTEDRVFLLSLEEINQYGPFDKPTNKFSGLECQVTEYARAKGVKVWSPENADDGKKYAEFYWLRSPGSKRSAALNIFEWFGTSIIWEYGFYVNTKRAGVRPAIWVALAETTELEASETSTEEHSDQ